MNVRIQIYAKKSHDKPQEWSSSDFFSFFLGLFIYFFHTVLHCIILKGLKSTLFSRSFLYYVLEELVSIIQYYDVYESALKSAQC